MTVLEASYIVFLLQPFHANIGKRLIKSPKIYFYDVGLASWLCGIENQKQIRKTRLKIYDVLLSLSNEFAWAPIVKFEKDIQKLCEENYFWMIDALKTGITIWKEDQTFLFLSK